MALKLLALRDERFVGDSRTMVVHDRLSEDCEDCLMDPLIQQGIAVSFEPDTETQAFEEGYDYCDYCCLCRARRSAQSPGDSEHARAGMTLRH